MAVAGVAVRAEVVEGERQVPRSVCAVDDSDDSCFASPVTQLCRRQYERRLGGDVAEEEHAGARCHGAPDRVNEPGRVDGRQRDVRDDEAGVRPTCDLSPQQLHRTVLAVSDDDLVARRKGKRRGHGVERRRRVRDEDEPVRLGDTEVRRQLTASVGEQIGQPPPEELDGIALQRVPQLPLPGEDRPRRGAEGAVVEMGDAGVEQEVGAELLCRWRLRRLFIASYQGWQLCCRLCPRLRSSHAASVPGPAALR